MRCDEVIRELSVPTPGRDDLAISRHLTGCEACSRWAEQAAKFDRLWDATQPAEPSVEAWDHLWSSVTAQLDRPALATVNGMRSIHAPGLPSAVSPAPSGRGRYWRGLAAVGMIGLAQAAALLIAVGITWRRPDTDSSITNPASPADLAQNLKPSLDSVFDLDEGDPILIHLDGKKAWADKLTAQDTSNGVDEWYVFFNELEPMAKSVMAMSE
jgi:hypothetical protein